MTARFPIPFQYVRAVFRIRLTDDLLAGPTPPPDLGQQPLMA